MVDVNIRKPQISRTRSHVLLAENVAMESYWLAIKIMYDNGNVKSLEEI
jgi:hypothetical protein